MRNMVEEADANLLVVIKETREGATALPLLVRGRLKTRHFGVLHSASC
jgi:hypothetical protein